MAEYLPVGKYSSSKIVTYAACESVAECAAIGRAAEPSAGDRRRGDTHWRLIEISELEVVQD